MWLTEALSPTALGLHPSFRRRRGGHVFAAPVASCSGTCCVQCAAVVLHFDPLVLWQPSHSGALIICPLKMEKRSHEPMIAPLTLAGEGGGV